MIEKYIYDVANELRNNAVEIRDHMKGAADTEREFLTGKLLAYNEVLSLFITQARSFGIDPALLGLADFDPDRDL